MRSQSASIIGYHETWTIEGLPDLPVFAKTDVMGSGRTEDAEGRTEYATTEVRGDVLEGAYQRDGHQRGTFRMIRAGEVKGVGTQRSQSERLKEHLGAP